MAIGTGKAVLMVVNYIILYYIMLFILYYIFVLYFLILYYIFLFHGYWHGEGSTYGRKLYYIILCYVILYYIFVLYFLILYYIFLFHGYWHGEGSTYGRKWNYIYTQPVDPYGILEANDVFESVYAVSHSIPFAVLPIITFCCVIISIGISTMPDFEGHILE